MEKNISLPQFMRSASRTMMCSIVWKEFHLQWTRKNCDQIFDFYDERANQSYVIIGRIDRMFGLTPFKKALALGIQVFPAEQREKQMVLICTPTHSLR
jgi:hypothetical protein